jgi:hypothetical protein
VGPLVGFSLGVVLAWVCRGEARREDAAVGAARARVAALFAGLCFAPACAWFVVFACDWSLFYLVDGRAVPSALLLVLVVLDAAAVVGGFAAGYGAARRGARSSEWTLPALFAAPAAVAVLLVLAFLPRLRVDGTFNQVSARFGTRPVAGGPLGYAILWMGAMIALGMGTAVRALAPRAPRPAPPVQGGGDSPGPPALLGRKKR